MRIAICDDDASFISHASVLLKHWTEHSPAREVTLETFTDGDSLTEAHALAAFDLILLDVIMPAIDGISVARRIRSNDRRVKIVFLTSSSEFAVDSYTVKATNYLLKPLNPTAFFKCMDEIEQEDLASSCVIPIKGAWAVHRINAAAIELVEARGKHVEITLSGGKVIESIEPLYALESKLLIENGFFKCHRSYIVNINHIGTYSTDQVTMRSGKLVPISRSCRPEFKEAYFSVIFGKDGDGM